jgi:tRNA G10  N-methylase Trm11
MEAMLMGFDVIGSDISPESVMDSRINLAWLKEKFPDVRKRNFQVFRSDVTALKDEDVQKALNGLVGGGVKMEELKAVVTESYLGPPVETEPHVEKCAQVDEDLSYLHKKGFEAFAKIFPEVPVVMTLPFYRLRSGAYEMKKTVEKISSVGYYCQALLPRERSIFYARDDQIVGRQLFRFKRK